VASMCAVQQELELFSGSSKPIPIIHSDKNYDQYDDDGPVRFQPNRYL